MGEQATSFGVGCWSCGDGDDGGQGAVWAERRVWWCNDKGGKVGAERARALARSCSRVLFLVMPCCSCLFPVVLVFSSFRRNFHGYSLLFLAFPCSSLLFLVFLCLSLLFIVFSLSVLLFLAILSYSLSFLLFPCYWYALLFLAIPCFSLSVFAIPRYSSLFRVMPGCSLVCIVFHWCSLSFLAIPCCSLFFFQNVAGPPPTKARSEEASRMPAAPAQSANEHATGA